MIVPILLSFAFEDVDAVFCLSEPNIKSLCALIDELDNAEASESFVPDVKSQFTDALTG